MPSTATIHVTVRTVHNATRSSNSQMPENEKNSIESKARLCIKNTCSSIFQKRSDSHTLERRYEIVLIIAGSEQTQ